MLFTKASEYALFAMIYLAKSEGAKDVDTIASDLGIAKPFLAKILQSLAKDGVLKSFKGVNGGFIIANKPELTTITSIIESAEKHKLSVFKCSGDHDECPSDKKAFCAIWPMFNCLQKKVDNFLDSITLADLAK